MICAKFLIVRSLDIHKCVGDGIRIVTYCHSLVEVLLRVIVPECHTLLDDDMGPDCGAAARGVCLWRWPSRRTRN